MPTVTPSASTIASVGRTERTGSTGLGLDIVTRLMAEVGGSLRTGTGPDGGALVEVTIPLTQE